MGSGIGSTELIRNRQLFSNFKNRVGHNIGAVLILRDESMGADSHFYHVTGHDGLFLYSGALVYPAGNAELVVAKLEEEDAKNVDIPFTVYETPDDSLTSAIKILKRQKIKTIGVNGESLTWAAGHKLRNSQFKVCDVSLELETARRTYTADELRDTREACNIAAEVAIEIPNHINEGMSELELAAQVEFAMKSKGSTGTAFPTIVAFGENSALPHYFTGKRKLSNRELVLVDFGATIGHMHSDVTFTCSYGAPKEGVREMYDAVRDAQNLAISKLGVGVNGIEVDKAVRALFDTRANGGRLLANGKFSHSTGHGLGLLTHNGGRLSEKLSFVIPEGFIVTVEPGWYVPGFGGIRLEHDVRVNTDGTEVLTKKLDFKDMYVV